MNVFPLFFLKKLILIEYDFFFYKKGVVIAHHMNINNH